MGLNSEMLAFTFLTMRGPTRIVTDMGDLDNGDGVRVTLSNRYLDFEVAGENLNTCVRIELTKLFDALRELKNEEVE